jgi:A/G-specific adenine glycosylase
MDFGATVCKPQNPPCKECPLKKNCFAFVNEKANFLPVKEKSIQKKERWFYFLVIQYGDKTYVRKRGAKDVWENLYEYVALEMPTETDTATFIKTPVFKKSMGSIKFEVKNISKVYRQLLSHQNIYGRFITITVSKPLKHLKGYTLANKKEIKKLPFPRLINNWHEDRPRNNELF